WGDDWLIGGAGNDHLRGGRGSDFMAGGDGSDTYAISTTGTCIILCDYERDVILADDKDNIPSQFNDLKRVDIGDVTLPSIEIAGDTYTLDADSLADFAHRVEGADIVYQAGD
ncbi:MAG: hypothetical protein OXL95_02225, partial [Nitrospira sp.]|nr:hypothetical protein [Nitrospira sp.]